MLVYSFHIYSWPAQLIKKVGSNIRNFIWAGDISVRKLVTVAWYKVCSQTNEGRLGLRFLKLLIKSALLKLAWEMMSSNHDWACLYRNRFGSKPLTKYFKSSIWPGIKDNWSLAKSNSIWLIGNGHNINFRTNNWLGDTLVDSLQIPETLH
ncbi:hypothetical protein Lalb_Chr18g0052071 [Lupinus albus]|uniref:Reverse transcriptase zinc-binding domain-containing protein n=1 Tax=Lupinus albus TaxID=3870 RepID=A0A6A4NKW1_LUPAL|nr:hypothetical protein Lalb_Chr18g0052071 [Lupinus albus]